MSFTPPERSLWVGTYPAGGVPDRGEGIWRVRLSAAGQITASELVVRAPAPSFLALHPAGHTLYAIGELPEGILTAFAVVDGDRLEPRGPAVSSGGAAPCHLVATADAVWVANYGDGTFSARPLDADGGLGSTALVEKAPVPRPAVGRDPERQAGPHAHFVVDLDGPVVVDLGADTLRDHRRPGATTVLATLGVGTGPRHVVRLPSTTTGGALAVVGELDPAVFILVPQGPGYVVAGRYDVCSASGGPATTGGRNYPSHIALSGDGRRLYVAVRGADVMSVFAVDAAGDVPRLTPLAEFSCGGAWPRHFAVLDAGSPVGGPGGTGPDASIGPASGGSGPRDLLVVANQESHALAVIAVDADGAATSIDTHALPAPACVIEG